MVWFAWFETLACASPHHDDVEWIAQKPVMVRSGPPGTRLEPRNGGVPLRFGNPPAPLGRICETGEAGAFQFRALSASDVQRRPGLGRLVEFAPIGMAFGDGLLRRPLA